MSDGSDDGTACPDVLVIGGGAAGMLSAITAARLGSRVVVIRQGDGATGQSSGAVDVADAQLERVPGADEDPWSVGPSIDESVMQLVARRPRHPYARIGERGRARLQESLELLVDALGPLGYSSFDGNNRVLVTQLGTSKRSALSSAHCCLDLANLSASATIAVCNVVSLGDFDAVRVQRMLKWVGSLGGHDIDVRVIPVAATFEGAGPFSHGRRMAAFMDESRHALAFAHALAAAVHDAGCAPDCVFLPPILGVRRAVEVRETVTEIVGCTVSEVLALPQSAPGARMSETLLRSAERAGVVVRHGEVQQVRRDKNRAASVQLQVQGELLHLAPRAIVLCSGRYFAGGLKVRQGARESILGLPVVVDGQPLGSRFVGDFLGATPDDDHPLFRAGIAYNQSLQPLTEWGELFAENVFAAGSVLEGYDPARDGSGLGVCALTGLLAGESAARYASEYVEA